MDLQLSGKTALVTGSTLGIGFAIAQSLAREGAAVVINGRGEERVQAAMTRLQDAIPDASIQGVAADLGTVEGAQAIIDGVPSVDILVNNVGIFDPVEFSEISDEDWYHFFDVNVMSGVRLSRAYLPSMRERNWGRIIFISSESAIQIPAEMVHYGMTKAAQIAIARGIAETTQGTAITVNSVLPGPTMSEGVEDFITNLANSRGISRAQMEEEFFTTARPSSLLRRFIDPDEVGNFVAYIASPLASATNGAALRVEGGLLKGST